MLNNYDIIVIGGGHAGVEASFISAKMKLKTLLITHLIDNIALASCNPAIGGLGKGHLVKEVDSLGGLMGAITDISGLQYRILNASKGPAVRGTRAQIDMDLYRKYARDILLHTDNLTIIQGNVVKILSENNEAIGVELSIKKQFFAKKIILTTGTFLKGLIHIGESQSQNGRAGEIASNELSQSLQSLGIPLARLKTGTCPRILGRSIDSKELEKHFGDASLEEKEANHATQSMQDTQSSTLDSNTAKNHAETNAQSEHKELLRNAMQSMDFGEWRKFQDSIQQKMQTAKRDSHTTHDKNDKNKYHATSLSSDNYSSHILFEHTTRDYVQRESYYNEAPYFSLLTYNYLLYHQENIISDILKPRIQKGYFLPQELPCFVTYTNEETHRIIEKNFYRAPLFTGQIQGVGPRYCPSIEDKINRFRDKTRHQLFLEPQTYGKGEYYINGLSTSLPYEVQEEVIHSIKGLENAVITRYGYAIEYDYSQPTNLYHTLESRIVKNLYFAGQINGTTGYEEAAAQGIMAGINAALSILHTYDNSIRESLILERNESYIGVMIDDLVTKGTNEPYRVFTSRAEYRLLLREDNACFRMLPYAKELKLLEETILRDLEQDKNDIESCMPILEQDYTPNKENLLKLQSIGEEGFNNKCSLSLILSRESISPKKMRILDSRFVGLSNRALKQLQIHAKYKTYIEKQENQIKRSKQNLHIKIPSDFVYEGISGLSLEVIEKLSKEKPKTLQEALRISGITPASLEVLELHIALYHKKATLHL